MSHAHAPHIDPAAAPSSTAPLAPTVPPGVVTDMPAPPSGFAACRVPGDRPATQVTHWVLLDSRGRNGGRPTVCGLTRFSTRDPQTGEQLMPADLPGWSMGGGVSGPGIHQVVCVDCEHRRSRLTGAA